MSLLKSGNFSASVAPLADRLRPRNFSGFVGQEKVVGPGKLLRMLVEKDELASIILWGPPGIGKPPWPTL